MRGTVRDSNGWDMYVTFFDEYVQIIVCNDLV